MNFSGSVFDKFRANPKLWAVGSAFTLTGIILALVIPFFITLHPETGDVLTKGEIIDFATDDDTRSEIYSYQTSEGEIQAQNSIWSSSPAYKVGDRIEVYYSQKNPSHSWIKDDKNLTFMLYFLRGMGIYFGLLGLGIIIMVLHNVDNIRIEVIVGAIGALSYGIPATIALPLMYYFFLTKPNFMFDSSIATFPQDDLIAGGAFFLTGLLDLAGTFFMLRHYKKTGSNSIQSKVEF